LNPAQIPANPPTMPKRAEDMEIEFSPQSIGRAPPRVEPTIAPSQIIDLVFIGLSIACFCIIQPIKLLAVRSYFACPIQFNHVIVSQILIRTFIQAVHDRFWISDMIETVELAKKHNYEMVISHRSGETEDSTIAHLAVGLGIGYIKTGTIGGERTAKHNELIRIEEMERA